MKSSACIVSVALLFLLSLGCSRRESRPSEPVASSSATVPPAASAADLQSHDDMLALTEQKAGLAHYPGAVISPTIPVAVRPDGSVQFALTTSDAMNQVVDHYVGELGLSFSGSLIAGEAKGRDWHIEISSQGSGTLVKVHSDPITPNPNSAPTSPNPNTEPAPNLGG